METALFELPWSAVHIATGVIFGLVLNWRWFKKLKPYLSIIITFVLLVAWEFFEYYFLAGIEFGNELLRNRISDVIFGFGAFLITYFIIRKKK